MKLFFALFTAALLCLAPVGALAKNSVKSSVKSSVKLVDDCGPKPAVPEPSAALAFALGAVVLSAATRKRKS